MGRTDPMRRLGFIGNFLVGCAVSLFVGFLFFAQGGFSEDVNTGKQIAIVTGLTLFGGLILAARSSGRDKAFNFGRQMRDKREEEDNL